MSDNTSIHVRQTALKESYGVYRSEIEAVIALGPFNKQGSVQRMAWFPIGTSQFIN